MLYMLQWLYTYVASFHSQCFICVFRTRVAIMFVWMLHMFHTYAACVFIRILRMVAMVFKCVSGVFFKCFISIFQVFQLPSDVNIFKNTSSVASLLLPPSAASSLPKPTGHPYEQGMGDGRGSCVRRGK
jgi:hypothetical protein